MAKKLWKQQEKKRMVKKTQGSGSLKCKFFKVAGEMHGGNPIPY